jgi:site-specific DNA-cytosine methylase
MNGEFEGVFYRLTDISFCEKELSLRKPRLLDCFCGMGGVSDGFALEGFSVTGIDIVDAPKMLGYKHNFIQANMLGLNGTDFQGYDVIWGSPPCRDFTVLNDKRGTKTAWKNPKNPQRGMLVVRDFIRFCNNAHPQFWILENVIGIKKCMTLEVPFVEPKLEARIGYKRHVFYGDFPLPFLPKIRKFKIRESCGWDKLASWKRAKIPIACSRAFARACRETLEPQMLEASFPA